MYANYCGKTGVRQDKVEMNKTGASEMKSLLYVRPVSRGPVSVSFLRQFPVPAEGRSPGLRIITFGRLPGFPVAYPASDSPEYSDEFVQDSHLFPFSPEHMQDTYLRHLLHYLIELMCKFYHIQLSSTTSGVEHLLHTHQPDIRDAVELAGNDSLLFITCCGIHPAGVQIPFITSLTMMNSMMIMAKKAFISSKPSGIIRGFLFVVIIQHLLELLMIQSDKLAYLTDLSGSRGRTSGETALSAHSEEHEVF